MEIKSGKETEIDNVEGLPPPQSEGLSSGSVVLLSLLCLN